MSKKYNCVWLFVALAIFMLAAIGCDESQSSEVGRLKREVADLESENQLLWEQAQQAKQAPDEPWRSLENWNRIRIGMTYNEVIEIMGHPREATDLSNLVWYRYGPEEGDEWQGEVRFSHDSRALDQFGRPLHPQLQPMVVDEVELPSTLQ